MDRGEIGRLLQRLTAIDAPSGREGPVQRLIGELCAPYAGELRVDVLGNVIARRPGAGDGGGGEGPRRSIMLAAHMDEIGLIVTRVEGSFLHVSNIGGVDPRSAVGQEVTVYASGPGAGRYPDGLPGYLGSRPPHVLSEDERKQVIPMEDLRIDVGFPVDGLVRVGDAAVWRGPYTELLGGRIAAKALDNRASVAAMIGALGYLAGVRHTWDVYAVATVQEEVGAKGATAGAFALEPDIAVAIDVTFANTPGVDDGKTFEMDKGPTIALGPNLHPGVVKKLRETAEMLEMDYTLEPTPGPSGTDAWPIQVLRGGIPCGLLGIPIRYMHSPVELVALADVDRTARLLAGFISRLDEAFLAGLPEEV